MVGTSPLEAALVVPEGREALAELLLLPLLLRALELACLARGGTAVEPTLTEQAQAFLPLGVVELDGKLAKGLRSTPSNSSIPQLLLHACAAARERLPLLQGLRGAEDNVAPNLEISPAPAEDRQLVLRRHIVLLVLVLRRHFVLLVLRRHFVMQNELRPR